MSQNEGRADCCVTEYIFSGEKRLNSLMSQLLFSGSDHAEGIELGIEDEVAPSSGFLVKLHLSSPMEATFI